MKASKWEINHRLRKLHQIMQEPHTLDELAQLTGRSKKDVYKDISKLAVQGSVIGRRLDVWWVEW